MTMNREQGIIFNVMNNCEGINLTVYPNSLMRKERCLYLKGVLNHQSQRMNFKVKPNNASNQIDISLWMKDVF